MIYNNNNGSTASTLHEWGSVYSRSATTNAANKSGPAQQAYGFESDIPTVSPTKNNTTTISFSPTVFWSSEYMYPVQCARGKLSTGKSKQLRVLERDPENIPGLEPCVMSHSSAPARGLLSWRGPPENQSRIHSGKGILPHLKEIPEKTSGTPRLESQDTMLGDGRCCMMSRSHEMARGTQVRGPPTNQSRSRGKGNLPNIAQPNTNEMMLLMSGDIESNPGPICNRCSKNIPTTKKGHIQCHNCKHFYQKKCLFIAEKTRC